MSASKKKRLGSQRRSLNPNVQESSQTSDQATSPSLLPQSRQRADANADLSLSTDSTESGTSGRKKKLGSQRGNKGKLQFKDISTDSSHKPEEEVEGNTTLSEPMDTLAIINNTVDVSLERDVKSIYPESEEAASNLVLDDAPYASLSIITDAVSPKADIQNTNMDSTSEVLLKVESKKYLAEIASTEEGVLSEKDCTQGVPDIFGGPIPAGVIEEGTCPVRLTQSEELDIFGSHDDNNKHNTEDKAGPMEKPVCQDRDKSALPTAKPRKMGSSRRKKVINFEELQEQGNGTAVQSNIFNTLETSSPTDVENTQEVNVSVAATEVTYKEESQEEENLSPKENVEDTDAISEADNATLPEIKELESSTSENILDEMKAKDDHMEEAYPGNEQLSSLQNSDLSEILFESADDKNVNTMDQPEPSIIDGLSIVYGQATEGKEDQDEDVYHTGEQLVQREESFDSSLQSVNSAPFSAPLDVSVNDVEAEIFEIEEGSSQPEPIGESDTQNFAFDRSESSSESISSKKDEKVESFFGSLRELKPSKDEVLHLNQDDILNLSSTTQSTDDSQNEAGLAQTIDVHQTTTSFVSETLEDHGIKIMIKSKIEDVKNDNLLGQQSEPLMSFIDEVVTDSSEPYRVEDQEEATLTHEQLDDIPSEPERPLNAHTEEINASLTSPFTAVASIDDVTSSWNNQDKTMELISTPDKVEIQAESILEEQVPKTPMDDKDQAGGQHEVDIASIQADNVPMEAEGETTGPDSALSESLLPQKEQMNAHQLFLKSDHEDSKNIAKPTDETGKVEIEALSETELSTEQPVTNETTGESFENVQRLDVQINAPDTDPPQGPVRRKFGSSRRSKVRKDDAEVASVYKEDPLNTENQNLASSINVQIDTQSEPIKEENIKAGNEVDAAVREMTSLNKVELDQMKEQMLEVEANSLGLDETLVDDRIPLAEQCTSNEVVISEGDKDENQRENVTTLQIPHTDDNAQEDATASVEDDTAVDSQLIGNGRRQDHDELKPREIDINFEMTRDDENQAAAPDKLDKSVTQVHNETLEAVEPLITNNESLKPKEVPSLFGAEQTDDDILNITDSQVLDTEILEQTIEKSPKPEDNSEQSEVNAESYALKQTVNVHQLTYISDSETHEEMDNSSLQQAEQQDLEEALEETSENSALINLEVNTSDSDTHKGLRRKLDSSQRTIEVISTPDREERQDESMLEEQGPKISNNKDQADGQHEMNIASIQGDNESMEAGGETTGAVLFESILPLKEPTNVHQLFFSSDNEDMKYTAKPTDETGKVEIEELSETELSTEQSVTTETTGEAFENVQRLDVQINAPDIDPHQGPVRRKFGSSRRSKARKEDTEVASVYKEDPLNTENHNLTSSINVQIDTQSEPIKEENVKADNEVASAVTELTPSNGQVELDQMKEKIIEVEANILGLDETVVDDGLNQTEQCTSYEVDKDGDQRKNVITVQIPQTDDSTQQEDTANVGDGSVVDSQLGKRRKLGSSRRIKERKQDTDELNPKEIDNKIEMAMDDKNQAAVPDELDKSLTEVHKETLEANVPLIRNDESLKPTEVTSFSAEQIADDDILNITDSQVLDTEILEHSVEESPEPEDFSEQSVDNTESYALKQTVNVHQLTYISDSETHEEMDNSSLEQAEQQDLEETVGETSENNALINMEVDTSDSDTHKGLRRKLGSSRRAKGAKLGVILSDSKDTAKDDEDASRVPEFVEACPIEEISTNFVSELDTQPINQGIFTKSDSERKKDAELLLQDKDPTVDTTQEKVSETQVRSPVEKTTLDTQKEIPDVEVESFTKEDLKDEGVVQPNDLPRDVGVDSISSSVAESEEITEATVDDAIQSFATSTKGITKEQEGIEVMEALEARPEQQVKSETKRRKMGSTRRSQLNRKQQDEEINTEDNGTKKDITPTVSEYAQILSSDIFENQGKAIISEGQIKNQHLNEDTAERQDVAQEDKEKILQTQTELVQDIDKGATMHTLLPISGEEIQPSSPGKRRKMGSTRKNLSSKREAQQAECVISENSEKEEVASISNDKENKENTGLLVYTATVHQPPPDEDTPLSQPVSQEKLRSESKEAELSSQHEEMSEDAAVARRRKMGSHRKPHSDQSIREEKVTDSGESLHPPLREKSPKLPHISEVNEGDKKPLSSASAFNIKLDSRPMSEKISQKPSLQSTNVHRVQESNIRISAGSDRSASRYEVVMIGDSSVGKTSFIQRAQSGKFSLDIPASIGMDSYKWTVVVNGKTIVLHLWDTAGQERFRSMTKQIFHRAQAFLLMYDVTCVQTFTAVSYWANCIKDGAAENAVVLLLGNKCDRTERKVRREEGEILAEENSFAFMECSAATGENVTEALETVARLLSQNDDRREEPLILRKPEPKNKLGCC